MLRFADEIGERHGEVQCSVLYNDGVVQAVTFACLTYWWVSCFVLFQTPPYKTEWKKL